MIYSGTAREAVPLVFGGVMEEGGAEDQVFV